MISHLSYSSCEMFVIKLSTVNSENVSKIVETFILKFGPIKHNLMQNVMFTNWPGHVKMCLMPYANNKGADQPAHPRSLISTFIVHCLDV